MILAKVEQAHCVWCNKDAAKEDNDTCPRETQWHLTKVVDPVGRGQMQEQATGEIYSSSTGSL